MVVIGLGPRLDSRGAHEGIEYALGVNEREFFASGPQGIVAGRRDTTVRQ